MNYSLKDLLLKYNLNAKKKWGQNWLIDQNIINKIINLSNVQDQEIIEIGPGLGALTFSLVKLAKKIIAYEIDPLAIKILQTELPQKNLQILHEDFLLANFPWDNRRILIGNIPYYITSEIIFKIIKNSDKFSRIILTIQDEFADRLVAAVGSKNYGKLTVSVNYFADVKKHFVIKPEQFFPKPKVNSAVISLTIKQDIPAINQEEFLQFVKKCFIFRRKTLFNNLKTFIPSHDKIIAALTNMNLKLTIRPQELSPAIFFALYNLFKTSE